MPRKKSAKAMLEEVREVLLDCRYDYGLPPTRARAVAAVIIGDIVGVNAYGADTLSPIYSGGEG